MDRDYDALFRIMILGDTGVGKTCLLQRFCDNEFRYSHVCTIGMYLLYYDVSTLEGRSAFVEPLM